MVEIEVLPGPYEILELKDKESVTIRVEKFKVGNITIHPRTTAGVIEKTVRSLRVWVPSDIKAMGAPYWDITSQTLIAQMEPVLERGDLSRLTIKIEAFGIAPRKRFTVTIVPR